MTTIQAPAPCEHNWLDQLSFAKFYADHAPPISEAIADHVCEHCHAIGMTCSECDGTGEQDECDFDVDDLADMPGCPVCKGQGVNVVKATACGTPEGAAQ